MDASSDIRELLAAARRGDTQAVGRMFEAARDHLLQIAHRDLPADVRVKIAPSDVVQETAVDMQRAFSSFRGSTLEDLFAWLRAILGHNMIDAIRHHRESLKRSVVVEVSFCESPPLARRAAGTVITGTPDGSAIRREEAAVVNEAMARLPADYRRVLQMRYWHGASFTDMAPALGRSPDAVRQLWNRAVERLQAELAGTSRPPAARSVPGDDR